MPEVSIILPTYNSEKYICETLNCLLSQTMTDIEIIIIDDGSVDQTRNLINRLIRNKTNCKYIYQMNSGAAIARKVGLSHATGRYIYFCDSDDLPHNKLIERLYDMAEATGADIVVCDYEVENRGSIIPVHNMHKKLVHKISECPIFSNGNSPMCNYGTFLWMRLFRKEIIKLEDFISDKEVTMEDNLFILNVMQRAKHIAFVDEPLYRYRIHELSLSNSFSEVSLYKHSTFVKKRIEFLERTKLTARDNIVSTYRIYLYLMVNAIDGAIQRNDYKNINSIMSYTKNDDVFKQLVEYKMAFSLKERAYIFLLYFKLSRLLCFIRKKRR